MHLWRSPFKYGKYLLALILTVTMTVLSHSPAVAAVGESHLGLLNIFLPESNLGRLLPNNGTELIVDECVYFDGRCLFTVAAPRSEIETRLNYIQTQLTETRRVYNEKSDPDVVVKRNIEGETHNIVIEIEGKPIRLMTVTKWDAELKGEDISSRTLHIVEQIQAGLERARLERTSVFLQRQGAIAGVICLISFSLLIIAHRWQNQIRKKQQQDQTFPQDFNLISTQLNLRKLYNIQEVQYRLSQLLHWGTITVAGFICLGLFPQTRITQVWLISIFKYPLKIAIIAIIAYLSIRLSYALIAKGNQLLTAGALDAFVFITKESNQRLQLRVDTFSQVMRSIMTLIILAIALLFFLWSLNINVAPILAGAGIIGLAISFAAQNFLKDIINGFCIIFEDQYAVGDVISVNNVSGFVENMNLRITQLRDAEGRLITIPNSEVRIVANLSNEWSRADLNIPVPYKTDVDFALKLITDTALAMRQDEAWSTQIIEDPLVLGVDNFHERGMMIKVWIKTLPLKQWAVSREYRRRLKNAFEAVGIQIPTSPSELWFHPDTGAADAMATSGDRPEQLTLFPDSNS
jgi:small-conductance mechanosensitive channel